MLWSIDGEGAVVGAEQKDEEEEVVHSAYWLRFHLLQEGVGKSVENYSRKIKADD